MATGNLIRLGEEAGKGALSWEAGDEVVRVLVRSWFNSATVTSDCLDSLTVPVMGIVRQFTAVSVNVEDGTELFASALLSMSRFSAYLEWDICDDTGGLTGLASELFVAPGVE